MSYKHRFDCQQSQICNFLNIIKVRISEPVIVWSPLCRISNKCSKWSPSVSTNMSVHRWIGCLPRICPLILTCTRYTGFTSQNVTAVHLIFPICTGNRTFHVSQRKQYRGLRSVDLGGNHLYHQNPSIDQTSDDRYHFTASWKWGGALYSYNDKEVLFSSNSCKVSFRRNCKCHLKDDPRR
jgi:hypothetical protein